jgi:hypothetical protein
MSAGRSRSIKEFFKCKELESQQEDDNQQQQQQQ